MWTGTNLLANVAEATVLSDTLKRLSQNGIEGFVAVAILSCGVARYGKSSNINLRRNKRLIYELQNVSLCIIKLKLFLKSN